MKSFFYSLLILSVGSAAVAAPILTISPKATTAGGRDLYTINLNPNGSVYDTLEIRATATTGQFNGASASATTPGSENTRPLNTVNVDDNLATGFNAGVTATTFFVDMTILGGDISAWNGGIAQLTGAAGLAGTVTLNFLAGGEALPSLSQTMTFGSVVVPPAPDLGLMATSGAGLSAALQGVWNSKVSGTSISLIDGLMITNDDPNSDDLGALGAIGSTVEITNYAGQGVIGTVTAGTTAGKYSLLLTGPFQSFDPSVPLTGNVNFTSANGGNASLAFSVAVPEPSTVALSALALVGLVGFARRKK